MTPDNTHQPSTAHEAGAWRGICTCGWRSPEGHQSGRARELAFRDAQDHAAIRAALAVRAAAGRP